MQKIVLFMEPNSNEWITPFKIGELFMNRFYFEEKASFKIVKIFELGKSSHLLPILPNRNAPSAVRFMDHDLQSKMERDRKIKGMNLST